jgi:hypothetical protein
MPSDPRGVGGGGPARGPGTPAQMMDPSQFQAAMNLMPSQSPSLTLSSLQGLHQQQLGQRRLPDINVALGGGVSASQGFYEQP